MCKPCPSKQQCITLVDYYVPLFFLEVSMVNPEKFCESVHLCKKGMKISLPAREGTCGLYHHVIVEILVKLKDHNTQLEVIDLLLKTCSKAQNYEQQCKRSVLKYTPLILVKAEVSRDERCLLYNTCMQNRHASINGEHTFI